ncbi:hypothetical protein PC129_g15256 [Phytophthora cactorum]|uniref:Uncharacterized protein n=1 Tax=Phytophthora cactorum TaxID=29920 RepID=A0A8T1K4Y3_9STRA|nr:hypothetical protein Pcac1_g5877 [Phytophthora cactorum]KAG2813699.1 hypothetical protein PC112_g14630 [Phytophthora cactorum]KAG2815111.1 hypothetical protein PC111_g13703 [Phytophthora cactorum]KAG2850522.1 hypothetical protein PC113_g16708 [Phytophthora cactorum]KAG2888411.1 hypothetical protein PC114_g18424 [Phytophthora cactorum]
MTRTHHHQSSAHRWCSSLQLRMAINSSGGTPIFRAVALAGVHADRVYAACIIYELSLHNLLCTPYPPSTGSQC